MEKRVTVFLDFDGTVALSDVGYSMVKKYAGPGWEEINALWEKGVLSTGQCAQKTLDLFEVDPAELQAYFYSQELDPGFPSFMQWLQCRKYSYCIVSDGYDNYIDLILRKYKLKIEYYANHLDYENGWSISSPHLNPECGKCGTCKSQIIKRRHNPKDLSVYVGDGYSDRCAAANCDIILAKNALADYCSREGIAYYAFQDFYNVKIILEKILFEGKGTR